MADLAQVKDAVHILTEELREAQRDSCECEVNATDNKGPCGPCNYRHKIRTLLKRGNEVVAIMDPLVFDHEATQFLVAVRNEQRY